MLDETEARSLTAMERERDELDAWFKTTAWAEFRQTVGNDIAALDQVIAYAAESWEEVIQLRMERETRRQVLSSFEQKRAELDEAIDQLVEKQQESTTTQENNENENDEVV